MTTLTITEKGFRFLDLPKELRSKVLFCTGLVIPPARLTLPDGPRFAGDLEIHCNIQHISGFFVRGARRTWDLKDTKHFDFPGALFRVSKLIRTESMEVMFSYNRLCLCCSFQKDLEWLQQFPRDMLQKVRKLDLVVNEEELYRWAYNHDEKDLFSRASPLLSFINDNFNIPRLFLSFDGQGEERGSWSMNVSPGHALDFWDELGRHVKTIIGNRLERFNVYLTKVPEPGWNEHHLKYPDWEKVIEQDVMGPEYDSAARGKAPRDFRRPGFPHQMGPGWRLVGGRMWPEDDGKGPLQFSWSWEEDP